MSQRNRSGSEPTTGRGSAGRQAAGRAAVSRGGKKGAPVKKPFPWGFAAGSAVLVLALGAILGYAINNQGVGDHSSVKYAESKISGLRSSHSLTHDHVAGLVGYRDKGSVPPDGGNHNPVPQSCAVYTAAIPDENAVHSLEHGAVWATYNPATASAADIATLKGIVDGNPYRMLSPYPGLKSPVSLQAWGEQLFVTSAKDKRVDTFFAMFTNGPQTREQGASCQGNTSTGSTPGSGATSTPPTGSAPVAPSGAATAAPTKAAPSVAPTKK